MHKDQITDKEGICILTIFIMGSTLILGTGGDAKNDAWLAGITGMIMALPIMLVYARLLSLHPNKDLFDILDLLLGKLLGKVISLVYIWYSFHLGALVIRNFGEFINTVAMPETPLIFTMLCLGLVAVIAVKSGIKVIGRISAYSLPYLLIIIAIVQLLSIPILDFTNIKPILGGGLGPVLKGGFAAFSFPFAETVLFIGIFYSLKNQKSHYKAYLSALLLAGFLIVLLTVRNILVLGGMLGKLYFPSHVAVSRIRIGDFLERIEVTVAVVFVFGVFIKSSICLFVSCKGIAKIFRLKDYRSIVVQTGILMVFLAFIIYDTIMEMQFWAFKVYTYYAFPFQVIMPATLWILSEISKKRTPIKSES